MGNDMKKYLVLFVAVAFLGTGCKKRYEKGFKEGEAQGTIDGQGSGLSDGYNAGYNSAYNTNYNSSHQIGHADGYAQGLDDGEDYYTTHVTYADGYGDGYDDNYDLGHSDGYNTGYNSAYTPAYNDGYAANGNYGYNHGYNDGYDDSYSSAYSDGSSDGWYDGYDNGYDDGYDGAYGDGYSDGYYDGYDAGIGSNVKTKSPSVKLAAMVNQDLFDYSKMQKFDSKSILDGGAIALNHADSGSVDMEKLAALKEQHYLSQMAAQVQVKFGLSAERSKEIATIAHQFNRLAGTRELTEKDSNVFAVGVIGASMTDIEAAVKKSLKGDSKDLDVLLEDIAQVNKTTPENVSNIINQIFF